MVRWLAAFLVFTLLGMLPAFAGFAMMAKRVSGKPTERAYIITTSDVPPKERDGEQRFMYCKGPGYIAWARGPKRLGYSCGYSNRLDAMNRAVQECGQECTLVWTAYDDDQRELGRLSDPSDIPGYEAAQP